MKILKTILLSASLLAGTQLQAQTFHLASSPEIAYPNAAMGLVKTPDHVSCYGFYHGEGGLSGNFYAYSWSNSNLMDPYTGTISYLFSDPSNSFNYDMGTIKVKNAMEIEVGTIDYGGTKYVVASYYNTKGVFVNVYKYVLGSGLAPVIMERHLSKTGKFPRIDSHKGYAIAMCWQEEKGIMVSTVNNMSGVNVSAPLLIDNTENGTIPDVAFGHEPDLNVRIAYYDKYKATINVIYQEFFTVAGWSSSNIPFNLENVKKRVKARYIDLDCPDHFTGTRWAYVYDDGSDRLITRSYVSGLPIDFEITDPSLYQKYPCRKPSIAYSNESKVINVAWSIDPVASPNNYILAVMRDITGSYITPYNEYLLVANDMKFGKHNYVALSKCNEHTDDLFTVYSMHPDGDEMRYKYKPYGNITYKGSELSNIVNNVSISPNPFEQGFNLAMQNVDGNTQLQVQIVDIGGRTLYKNVGDINVINADLVNIGQRLLAGMYLIHINADGVMNTQKVIKQ